MQISSVLRAVFATGALFVFSQTINANPVVGDFSLQTNEGASWQLSDFAGRPKLLMFWATWCPPCKKLFPTIQAVEEEYAQQGVVVVAISVYDEGDTRMFAISRGLSMTILEDGEELSERFGIPGTPTVLLLDSDNRVAYGAVNPPLFDPLLFQTLDALVEQSPSL